jgi:gas vesicle protein
MHETKECPDLRVERDCERAMLCIAMSKAEENPSDASAPKAKGELRGQLEEGLGELKTMAGDLGLRLSGAATEVSAEAKETWKKMEPQVKEKLKTAEQTLEQVTDTAAEQLKGLFGELKASMQSLKDKL